MIKIRKIMFWIGAIFLVVGLVLFYYGYSTIQNIKDRVSGLYTLDTYFLLHPDLKQQWDLAQILQPLGLGVLVLGAIILAYGLLVKKESK